MKINRFIRHIVFVYAALYGMPYRSDEIMAIAMILLTRYPIEMIMSRL